MPYVCKNYSYLYQICKFIIIEKTGLPINKKDLIKECNGLKSEADCCWYQVGVFVK